MRILELPRLSCHDQYRFLFALHVAVAKVVVAEVGVAQRGVVVAATSTATTVLDTSSIAEATTSSIGAATTTPVCHIGGRTIVATTSHELHMGFKCKKLGVYLTDSDRFLPHNEGRNNRVEIEVEAGEDVLDKLLLFKCSAAAAISSPSARILPTNSATD